MSRSVRLFDLTNMLAGRRARTLSEIVERFDVSERTAYRDLAELGRMVPLVRTDHGYQLMDGATLRPLNLTVAEHALLRVALENPALRRHPEIATAVESLHAKLDAATRHLEESPLALQLAGPDRSGALRPGVLEILQQAILEQREAEIRYTSLSGLPADPRKRWRTLEPLRLFERSGAWYLAAHCHVHDEVRLFRLDRIEEAKPRTQRAERRAADFDLDAHLAGAWGAFVGDRELEIELVFDAALAPLFTCACHHRGERVDVRDDGKIAYRVTLTSLEEIARWVLGFGSRVEVVAPDELRERVVELARGALEAAGSRAPTGSVATARS